MSIALTESNQTKVINRLVEISLFSWRRAEEDDPIDDDERYGWWGDSYPAISNQKIGSRLWLLKRRTLSKDTILDAEHYINEALQWMIDDQLLTRFEVKLTRVGLDQLKAVVTCYLSNNNPITYLVNDIWGALNNAV